MNIVIIGTGNAATVLGKKLKEAGHHIVQVFGRDASAASNLAYQLDTESTNYWSVIRKNADFYLIAVADDAIAEVAKLDVRNTADVNAFAKRVGKIDILLNAAGGNVARARTDKVPAFAMPMDAFSRIAACTSRVRSVSVTSRELTTR